MALFRCDKITHPRDIHHLPFSYTEEETMLKHVIKLQLLPFGFGRFGLLAAASRRSVL